MIRSMDDDAYVLYHAGSDTFRICDASGRVRDATILDNSAIRDMQTDINDQMRNVNIGNIAGIMQHARHGTQFKVYQDGRYKRCEGLDVNDLASFFARFSVKKSVQLRGTPARSRAINKRITCLELELALRLQERVLRTAIFYTFMHHNDNAI